MCLIAEISLQPFNSLLRMLFQGFEVVVGGNKYFAFSKYEVRAKANVSICDRTLPGWSHEMSSKNWACYVGYKTTKVAPKTLKPSPSR